MVTKKDRPVDRYMLTVEGAPAEVDAGAEFAFSCRIAHSLGSDQSGLAVSIRDHGNAELALAALAGSGGVACVTDDILLKAPLTKGEHIYRAVLVTQTKAGAPVDMTATEFPVVVKAHAMRLNVWDLPSAIVAGESFTFKAGIKCSAGCDLAGRDVDLFDGDGNRMGAGTLRNEVWPGTSALQYAEIDGKAPSAAGNARWEIRISEQDAGVPHAAGALALDVEVVAPPDCAVTIEAADAGTHAPIGQARVVLHPYRAVTGEDGVATLKVVKGSYRLLVSASRYLATAMTVEVAEDLTVRAELTLEPVVDPASYYA